MEYTLSIRKEVDRSTKQKTSFMALLVGLFGDWLLLGLSMPVTKDMEVRKLLL